MISIEVRPAQNGDVETMAAIYVDAARDGWAHIFGEQSLKTLKPPVDRLRAELASTEPRQQVLVADREARVIAFAVVRPSQDEDADSTLVGELDQFLLRHRGDPLDIERQPSSPADTRGSRLETRRRDARQAVARSQRPRPALPNQALAGANRDAARRASVSNDMVSVWASVRECRLKADLLSFGRRSSDVAYVALLGKEGPPPPLSAGEALLGVGLVLAGIAVAVAVAALRSRSNRF